MQPPDEPRGSDRQSGWLRKLLAFARSCQVVEGIGYRINRSHRGTSLEILPGKGGGSTLKHYRVKSIEGDFMTCREWGGSMTSTAADGTTDIYIARDPELRRSTFEGKSIAYNSDGDSFTATYVYSSNTKRVKTVSGTAETQVIIPYYKTDLTVILAAESANGTGVTDPDDQEIRLVEVTQRAWAKFET